MLFIYQIKLTYASVVVGVLMPQPKVAMWTILHTDPGLPDMISLQQEVETRVTGHTARDWRACQAATGTHQLVCI